jgi:hypothetical protein
MDILPSDDGQEIRAAGLPPGESSSGQSRGGLVSSPQVISHDFSQNFFLWHFAFIEALFGLVLQYREPPELVQFQSGQN